MQYVLVGVILISHWLLAVPVLAQRGLVPCDGTKNSKCELAQVLQLGQNILDLLVKLGGIVLVIIIIVGGVYLASSRGSAAVATKIKSLIANAIIGYILLLAAWLLVETFFKFFAGDGVGMDILKGG